MFFHLLLFGAIFQFLSEDGDFWFLSSERNAIRRSNYFSKISQAKDQFRLYRLKGVSVTAAVHIIAKRGQNGVKL